ncbi:MAG: hypothetical protein GKR91_11240 [Pseudomonadales bacterium]|nr:hypothetical protein [Pseudomonadales bacterium]
MFKLTTFLFVLLLSGCVSRTQVHIFSLGVEDEEISRLSSLFNDEGFEARPNELPVPGSIFRHTVIFPAIVQDFAIVELVESAMERAGYLNSQLILETEANHYYSTDNIGVYLVNPDFKGSDTSLVANPYLLGGEDSTPLTYNYYSECPEGSEAQSELNLYPAGVVLLEEFIWSDEDNREVSVVHDGEWESDSSSVEISIFEGGELRFSIEEHSGSNWFGPFQGLTLKSQYSSMEIEQCDYTHLIYEDSNF